MDILHADCGGGVIVLVDGEESETGKWLVVKLACQKCGEEEEVLRFSFSIEEADAR